MAASAGTPITAPEQQKKNADQDVDDDDKREMRRLQNAYGFSSGMLEILTTFVIIPTTLVLALLGNEKLILFVLILFMGAVAAVFRTYEDTKQANSFYAFATWYFWILKSFGYYAAESTGRWIPFVLVLFLSFAYVMGTVLSIVWYPGFVKGVRLRFFAFFLLIFGSVPLHDNLLLYGPGWALIRTTMFVTVFLLTNIVVSTQPLMGPFLPADQHSPSDTPLRLFASVQYILFAQRHIATLFFLGHAGYLAVSVVKRYGGIGLGRMFTSFKAMLDPYSNLPTEKVYEDNRTEQDDADGYDEDEEDSDEEDDEDDGPALQTGTMLPRDNLVIVRPIGNLRKKKGGIHLQTASHTQLTAAYMSEPVAPAQRRIVR
jgi:hypothetical protein